MSKVLDGSASATLVTVPAGIAGKFCKFPCPSTYCPDVPAQAKASVPLDVIGVPLTPNAVPPTDAATDVTVPVLLVQVGLKYSNAVSPVLTLNN